MAKRREYEWMYVTDDKYELPMFSAETATDLAKLIGILPNSVRSGLYEGHRAKGIKKRKGKIIKVEIV